MRAIVYGALAAVVIGIVAGYGLSMIPSDAGSSYASGNVRL